MKDLLRGLLQNLPQILQIIPGIAKYLPILLIIGAVAAGAYYFVLNYKDPYKCVGNEVWEQIRWDSNVYIYKGGYCI